jgi:hypothetical protein
MKKIVIVLQVLALFIFLVPISKAISWDNKITHRDLTELATRNSALYPGKEDYLNKNLGFEKGTEQGLKWESSNLTVLKWLQQGAEKEDTFPRYLNHFHQPLKPWDTAGLDDWVLLVHTTGQSALCWAQDETSQSGRAEGDWSWGRARQEYFAKTFRGLEHRMHLAQDMADGFI